MAKKIRADQRLLDQGLVEDVKKAQAFIMSGDVFTVKNERILTSGQAVKPDTELRIKRADHPYVSRGGLKLKKAVDCFDLDFTGKRVLDIGSSTGGFTDVALREGASLVYAIDVGTNQLVWSLRQDDRVVVMEQTNFKVCKPEDFIRGLPNIAVIDVSFISLDPILETLSGIIQTNDPVVALIKPQFEAERDQVEAGGLITDPAIHREVLEKTSDFMVERGFALQGLTPSPIKGGKGNIEFIALLQNQMSQDLDRSHLIERALKEAKTV